MQQHHGQLVFGELELILPEIAALPVVVLLHLRVVRKYREAPLERAYQAPQGIEKCIVRIGIRRVVRAIIHQVITAARSPAIDAQQRMPKHGCRVVHEIGCKYQRRPGWIQRLHPAVEPLAGLHFQAGIERQPLVQPSEPGGKIALRMLLALRNTG